MKILLVSPGQATSLFTFSDVEDITGSPAYMPNLALPTLAAMTPPDFDVTIVDEMIEPIEPYFEQHWDLVGITGYITHEKRMFAVADEFRRRGDLVAIGGPYATLSSSRVRPHADVLFVGEAEKTWPAFLNDFRSERWKDEYRATEAVDIGVSPIPDASKLRNHGYWMGVVQTSRGCPFECEFCDVIIYLGRKQRHKTPERVVLEIERMYQAGYRAIFLSDDNFTANKKKSYEIVRAIADWNRTKPERTSFSTQLSVDIVRDPELLRACSDAGLTQAFIGLETPNQDALREVKKRQNVRSDLISDVHTIQRQGVMVQAGMISGFDADTLDSFRNQYNFLQWAGIPMASITMLNAPEGTPLEKRLIQEKRLVARPMDDFFLSTNIIPKQMSPEQLHYGTQWLLNKLFSPDAFLERVAVLSQNLPPAKRFEGPAPRASVLWRNMIYSFERLGPEFSRVPREALKLFRGKDTHSLGTALIFYKSVVSMLRKEGLWDQALARLESPDFQSLPSSEASYFLPPEKAVA
jgi:radical SAM superfamily enzyme YgiQ (UPF0313 family)